MPALAKLARLVLSVPASSAPVERVFSHGGIIFRPHRRGMSDANLYELIYLKCNSLKYQVALYKYVFDRPQDPLYLVY